ncbi:MAG: BMP family ABC transporter substrate-binding protein [Anaerolineae bacterium]|nr:MAG: BMP family ABC transporter substrate-binding protein [Anaerolineae bacterium]
MNIRKLLTALIVLAVLVAALPAAAQEEIPKVKVALILPGRADDVSWNQASFEGMNAAVEALEGEIEVELTVVEQVYDPVDIEPALLDYAQQGYDLIVGHGFQFQEPIIKVAEDYPDVNFAIGTGFKLAPNVGVYDVKLEQGGYLMGLIAGYLTKSNIVGVVGGVDVSEIHRGHVAFVLGAQAINEDVEALSNFVGDFNDLAGAKEAALSQIKAGADVLWQSGDGIGIAVLGACEEEGILCMGNVANQNDIAPENTLASFVYDWGPVYKQMIEETVEGTFGDKYYWIELANEGVSVVYNEELAEQYIDEDLQAALDEAVEGFVEGTLDLGDLDAYKLE